MALLVMIAAGVAVVSEPDATGLVVGVGIMAGGALLVTGLALWGGSTAMAPLRVAGWVLGLGSLMFTASVISFGSLLLAPLVLTFHVFEATEERERAERVAVTPPRR